MLNETDIDITERTLRHSSQKEVNAFIDAINALDKWMSLNDTIKTENGEQYTLNGYLLENINFTKDWVRIDAYILDRSIQQKDNVNLGDRVRFNYKIDKDELIF